MGTAIQGQPASQPENPRYTRPSQGFIIFVVIVTIVLLGILGTLSILGMVSNKLALIIAFVIPLGTFLLTLIRTLIPQNTNSNGESITLSQTTTIAILPDLNMKYTYSHESFIKKVYAELIETNTTAMVLTGSSGAGKSTLAALLYKHAEEKRQGGGKTYSSTGTQTQQQADAETEQQVQQLPRQADVAIEQQAKTAPRPSESKGPFTAQALWLTVDANMTVTALINDILTRLGKAISHFDLLPLENQIQALMNALDTPDESRLICIDQFENLFGWGGGAGSHARPGVNELLYALGQQTFTNSQSRILFTCTSVFWKLEEQQSSHLKEQHVGWSVAESLEFLKKLGVDTATIGVETERMIGHLRNALALILLASLLPHSKNGSPNEPVHNTNYKYILKSNSIGQLLDHVWRALSSHERSILLGFSVYREPVPSKAALAVAMGVPPAAPPPDQQLQAASSNTPQPATEVNTQDIRAIVDRLLDKHLLIPMDAELYQPHPVVANFARDRFGRGGHQANYQARQEAHARAAQFYLQEVAAEDSPEEQQWSRGTLHLFIEAAWQYCRAGKFREAYELMEQQDIFPQLSRWGDSAILLELYQLLLPLDKWRASRLEMAHIYNNLGEIYLTLENRERAQRYFEDALPLFQEEQYHAGEGRTLYNLGLIYYMRGQEILFWQDLEHSWEFLPSSEQVPDDIQKKTRKYRKQSMEAQSSLNMARHYLEQALPLRREAGDYEGAGKTLHMLGRVYSALTKKELAQEYYETAVDMTREAGDRLEEGRVLHDLGRLCNKMGKKERPKALEYLEQALRIQQEIGDRKEEGATWNSRGRAYDNSGRKEEAWLCYQQALYIAKEVGDRRGEAITLHNIGAIYLDLAEHEDMLRFLLLAKALFEEIRNPSRERDERRIDRLREELEGLVAKVQPDMISKVERRLQEGLPREKLPQKRGFLSFSLPGSRKAAQAKDEPPNDASDNENLKEKSHTAGSPNSDDQQTDEPVYNQSQEVTAEEEENTVPSGTSE